MVPSRNRERVYPMGECPECHDVVSLNNEGTLWRHGKGYGGGNYWCPGVGRFPVAHVHHCRCGATWDESQTSTSGEVEAPSDGSIGPEFRA